MMATKLSLISKKAREDKRMKFNNLMHLVNERNLIANIYLHYLLDLWFIRDILPNCRGKAAMIRCCDDFLICLEREDDAEELLQQLEQRLEKGKLKLSPEKTSIVEFRRPNDWSAGANANVDAEKKGGKPGIINFLGFTHYWEKSRKGFYKVGRRTENQRLKKAVGKVKVWLRANRNRMQLKDIWKRISQMLIGHYSYYGVIGNFRKIKEYLY